MGLSRDDLIQALGLSFTVSTIALAAGLASHGAFQVEHIAMSSLAVLPALLGMWLGQLLRQRISPATFRRWFLIFLILLGLELAAAALPRSPDAGAGCENGLDVLPVNGVVQREVLDRAGGEHVGAKGFQILLRQVRLTPAAEQFLDIGLRGGDEAFVVAAGFDRFERTVIGQDAVYRPAGHAFEIDQMLAPADPPR